MKDPRPVLPIFAVLFVSIFGFIGLTVLIFLWSSGPLGPPLFFKVFGSFIALAFMIFGFGVPLTALLQRGQSKDGDETDATAQGGPSGYRCPNCGAGLGKQEVSPSGDVKCTYCQRWYNIHRNIG